MRKSNCLPPSIKVIKISLIVLFTVMFISSCKDRSPQPEPDKTLGTDTTVVPPDTSTKSSGGKITKEEVLKMFSKESHNIENKFDQIQK
ncbi:MAG: hypothetical protein ACPL2D_06690, partial [Ignavibacteria bacterium]